MVAVTQVVKSCSRALSRYLGMDSLLTKAQLKIKCFHFTKIILNCFFKAINFFRFKIQRWADLIYSLITSYVALCWAECNTLGRAQSAQASRAFLQLAPNIKAVYVPKFSLDGHSESVRQGISDFLSVLSPLSSLILLWLHIFVWPGPDDCWWGLLCLKTFLISNVGVKIDSSDESQRPQPGTKTLSQDDIPSRESELGGPGNVFLIEYDGK